MGALDKAIEEYLQVRRSLGFGLQTQARYLRSFAAFAESEGASFITMDLALRWAKQPAQAQPVTWARRLGMVRRFAVWHSAADPRTELPPSDLLPHRQRRKPPYIYSDCEIEKIVEAAARLPSAKGLRACTYYTLFGLLAATGMRVSEALALDNEDLDLKTGLLTIRRTKFGKSRLIALHPSTCDALETYTKQRNRILPRPASGSFFVSKRGLRLTEWITEYNFAKVAQQIGLREPGSRFGHGPRLHGLRHHFAVKTLIDWYRAGLDVEREMPKLATYLGHAHVNYTYWYLESVPELLQLATERLIGKRKEVE